MTLDAHGLHAGYGSRTVLNGIDLTLAPSRITGIIGPNGCGKSTLMKVLSGLLKPTTGQVLLDDRPIANWRPARLARRLAVLPQQPVAPPGLTVAELVGLGRYPHVPWFQRLSVDDRRAIDTAILACGLESLSDRRVDELSGGERQRAWIAMALAQSGGGGSILLLDEPITFLDICHQLEVLELLANLNRAQGLTVLMVLHDLNLAARYCDQLVALKQGRVAAAGPVNDVFRAQVLADLFEVRVTTTTDPHTNRPVCHCLPRETDDGDRSLLFKLAQA